MILLAGIYIGSQGTNLPARERYRLVMLSKSLIRKINRRDFDVCSMYFNEETRKESNILQIRNTLIPALNVLGTFQRFRTSVVTKKELDDAEYTVCQVRCDYSNGPAIFNLLFDKDYLVAGMYIE